MPFNLCKTVEVEPVVKLTVGLPVSYDKAQKLERVRDDLGERSSSTPNTKEITPYRLLEVKVGEIQEQIENKMKYKNK